MYNGSSQTRNNAKALIPKDFRKKIDNPKMGEGDDTNGRSHIKRIEKRVCK